MTTLIAYFIAGIVLATGILLIKWPFFDLARKSVGLLDVMISDMDDDEKEQALGAKMMGTIVSLLKVLLFLTLTLVATWLVIFAADTFFPELRAEDKDGLGKYYLVPFTVGTILPFLKKSKSTSAYSDLAQLFHHLVLDHYHVGKQLLKRQIKGVENPVSDKPQAVIVTGLARAGTTALTRELAARGPFSSLDYSNMPVLLAPRLWAKLYKPKRVEDQERAHGDGIKVGLASVEALEEYFYKVVLNDRFITPTGIQHHTLSEEENALYRRYQMSITKPGELYLAKNNNCITRYESLVAQNPDMVVYIMLRDPLQHAFSLMKQHLKFEKEQQDDPFILTYMDWLGHHEFGKGQRPFVLPKGKPAPFEGDTSSLDYWITRWISYYTYVLSLENVRLLSYDTFLADPTSVLDRISKETGVSINSSGISLFDKKAANLPEHSQALADEAYELFNQLNARILR